MQPLLRETLGTYHDRPKTGLEPFGKKLFENQPIGKQRFGTRSIRRAPGSSGSDGKRRRPAAEEGFWWPAPALLSLLADCDKSLRSLLPLSYLPPVRGRRLRKEAAFYAGCYSHRVTTPVSEAVFPHPARGSQEDRYRQMFELRREVAIISRIYDGIDDALARFIAGQPKLFCRDRAA